MWVCILIKYLVNNHNIVSITHYLQNITSIPNVKCAQINKTILWLMGNATINNELTVIVNI